MVLEYLPTWLGHIYGVNVGIHIPAPWFASGYSPSIPSIYPSWPRYTVSQLSVWKPCTDDGTYPGPSFTYGCFITGWWYTMVYLPLWKRWKSVGIIVPNIWKNKKCSKPPTRIQSIVQSSQLYSSTQPHMHTDDTQTILANYTSRTWRKINTWHIIANLRYPASFPAA